ncbi:MAG: hypothetical protein H6658_15230 [Ardenticatenaceae bacterium]|nr:hypothetical protein [Ardenticatenaceae bacterium]
MNTNKKSVIQESKTKMTASALMQLAGVSVVLAGLCMIVMGMYHPVNVPEAVTTATWVNVHIAATAMGFFGLFGMAGLYTRQAEKSGWLGLAGFLLISLWFGIVMPLSFVEAFILPRLVTETPEFVAGFLGMFSGIPSEIDLGILPTLWNLSGPMFILGPLLFGIATFRARVLSHWAGGLLALSALLIPLGSMVPAEYQPEVALIPTGLALVWLGYALFSERREKASEPLLEQGNVKVEPSKAA